MTSRPPQQNPTRPRRKIICPKCSAESPAKARYCPNCNYVFGPSDRPKSPSQRYLKLDERKFKEELQALGFEPSKIVKKLDLQLSKVPAKTESIHVFQTNPQILVALPLTKLLKLLGICP